MSGHAATRRANARRRRPASAGRPRRGGPPAGIRWDRLGRWALLLVLGVILMLYAAPVKTWVTQKRTAGEHSAEVRQLEAENARLKHRARELARPDAIEREARRLGMVRQGERAYVIENAPR